MKTIYQVHYSWQFLKVAFFMRDSLVSKVLNLERSLKMKYILALLISATLANNLNAMGVKKMDHTTISEKSYEKGFIETFAGKIAYTMSKGASMPIVFIHGNSSSKEIFKKQFDALGDKYKLVAFDLPGHGESEDALNPESVYSFPGYTQAITQALDKLGIHQAIVCGWSLGGHIAIELLSQRPDLVAGLLITGTPPIPLTSKGINDGFIKNVRDNLTSKKELFSEDDARKYMIDGGVNPDEAPHLVKVNMRTDGNARYLMVKSVGDGVGANAKEVLENTDKPLTIIIGKDDPFVNNKYIEQGVTYNTLLTDKHVLDCGHSPHWENPEDFNNILDQFVEKILKSR